MKKIIFSTIFILMLSINAFAKISNPTFNSNEGSVDLTYSSSTTTYNFNLSKGNNNLSIKASDENANIVLMDVSSGEVISATNFDKPFNELNIDNLSSGEYSLLFSGSGDFSIFTNGIDLKDILTLQVSIENYEFKLDKPHSDIVIFDTNENAFINLSSTILNNTYQSTNEPFNSLKIASLARGVYQLNITINPTASTNEVINEPTIISADKGTKVSNPIVKSNGGEIKLTYTGYNKEYIFTLDSTKENITFKKNTNDCGFIISSDTKVIFDGCENNMEGEAKIDNLEVGEYKISVFNGDLETITSSDENLMDNLKLLTQSDHYEFISKNDLSNVYIENDFQDSTINLFSIEDNSLNFQSEESFLSIDRLASGRYQVNVNKNFITTSNIDKSQKFSNPKVLAGEEELKLNYVNFERKYQFSPQKDYENIVITKNGDGCGVMVKNISNGGEIINSCESEVQNILNIDLLKKGDYTISIIGSENFSITSNGKNIKELLKFNGKIDKYTLIINKLKRDITIKDNNESSMIEIFDTKNKEFKYVKSDYPFNFMSIPFLKAGTYGININAFIKSNTTFSRPSNAEVIEDENRTEIITKPIELISGYNSKIQTVIDDKGKVEATIGIRDKDDNLIKQTIFKAPKGGEVEMDESGNLKHTLITTITKAEITAKNSGEVEGKISINDTENLKREFIVPAGSQTEVKDDGTTTAMNELEGDKGSYETNVEVKPDGEVSATAFLYENTNQRTTKLSTGLLTASYTARRDFSSVKVEFIWNEVNSSRKLRATKIDNGLLKATYTTRRSFSFEGETLNFRSIDVSNSTNITITPSPEATFEENQEFLGDNEGYRTIELIEGEANITIDGQTSIMSSEVYILPKVDGKELYLAEGWNLISIPINIDISSDITSEDVNYTLDSFGSYVEFWKIDDNNSWEKNPDLIKSGEGFWIYLNIESYSLFSGSGYDINFSNLYDGWHLFGAGKDLENLKEEYNFNQVYKFSRENNDSTWIKNPSVIYRGEGFWVNKN